MKETCQLAIKAWGTDKQMDMAIEECSELIKTIVKFRRYNRNKVWRRKMIEEACDVTIMIEQLIQMFSTDTEFKELLAYKVGNLKSLLKNDDPERGMK